MLATTVTRLPMARLCASSIRKHVRTLTAALPFRPLSTTTTSPITTTATATESAATRALGAGATSLTATSKCSRSNSAMLCAMTQRAFTSSSRTSQEARSSASASPGGGGGVAGMTKPGEATSTVEVDGKLYPTDSWTNVTPTILQHVQKKLHLREKHPLNLIKQRIVNHFHKCHVNRRGNAIFSVFDELSPVVTTEQNFDSLLVPADHASRARSDSYFINEGCMLRAHTSAHQRDLIASGLDAFLVIGDVYRRDEIDRRHYPVFHQVEGVRLFTKDELFKAQSDDLKFFEAPPLERAQWENRQACHSMETVKMLEFDLKNTLERLVADIFQEKLDIRWVDTFFPFTHPSFELEMKLNDVWVEILGCGIVQQDILNVAGVQEKAGWAFGIGLERVAMQYYNIDDIRAFWSEDSGFHAQFNFTDPERRISFQPISKHPCCVADMSFWIPDDFLENDFYDVVRSVGGNLVQEVTQIDVFTHPKTGRTSHCYRITYRHMERSLTQEEANAVHRAIATQAVGRLRVEVR